MSCLRITAGPSKWDLLIKALAEGEKVNFTFEGAFGQQRVRIVSVCREDDSGESWLITGTIPALNGSSFRGRYFTTTFTGTCQPVPAPRRATAVLY